jgi:hypothetical protein
MAVGSMMIKNQLHNVDVRIKTAATFCGRSLIQKAVYVVFKVAWRPKPLTGRGSFQIPE